MSHINNESETLVVTQLPEKLRRLGGRAACQESWVAAFWYWNPSWVGCRRLWIISAREEMTQSRQRALLPSVSWPKQVDSSSSSSRSPAPSKASGLTGPWDGGPLMCVCSIFTTATFPCAFACRHKNQTLKKQKTHCLLCFFSAAICSKSHFGALSRRSDVEKKPNKIRMWPKWQWSYVIELHKTEQSQHTANKNNKKYKYLTTTMIVKDVLVQILTLQLKEDLKKDSTHLWKCVTSCHLDH